MSRPAAARGGSSTVRSVGLVGATGVGIGAIVGGGILVLAGLRARLLSSICREIPREVTFLRVLPENVGPSERRSAARELRRMARDKVPGEAQALVVLSDDPRAAILEHAQDSDLIVLGLQRNRRQRVLLAGLARDVAVDAACAAILLSRRRETVLGIDVARGQLPR